MAEETTKDIFSGKSEFDIPSFNSAQIDKEIASLSKPNQQNNVYSKLAAMYEQQGVGAVLRTQKNISNLFGPALDLYKQRKNAADEAFAINLENSPEIDDSFIFGELDGTPMPITDEIRGLSDVIRKDLRDLSYLNPTDPRYAELRKNIEENQDKIVKFNDLNKKLLNIRNSEVDRSKWSQGMKEEEVRMWDDIYNSKGENIKIINGQPTYVDPVNGEKIDLSKIGDSPVEKNEQAAIDYTNYNSIINNYASTGAGIDDFNYDKIIGGAFRFLGNLDNTKMSSLIFDGYNLDPILGSGPVTTDFLHGVIQQKYGNEIDTPEEFVEKINELKKIGINKAEFGEKGDKTLRQLFLEYEQEKAIDVIKSGDVSTIFSTDNENINTGKKIKIKNKNKKVEENDEEVTENVATSLESLYNGTSRVFTGDTIVRQSDVVLPTLTLGGTTHRNTVVTFENGEASLTSDAGEVAKFNESNKVQFVGLLQNIFTNATDEKILQYINNGFENSKRNYNESLDKDFGEVGTDKLLNKGETFGSRKSSDYLLSYGDEDFVINRLNDEYSKSGYTFKYEDDYYTSESYFLTDLDMLSVEHENYPGKKFFIRFDNASEVKDLESSRSLEKIMNALKNKNLKAAQQYADENGVDYK